MLQCEGLEIVNGTKLMNFIPVDYPEWSFPTQEIFYIRTDADKAHVLL